MHVQKARSPMKIHFEEKLERPTNSWSSTLSGTSLPTRSFTQVSPVRPVMPSPQQYQTIPTAIRPVRPCNSSRLGKLRLLLSHRERALGTRARLFPCCRYTNFCVSDLPLLTSYSKGPAPPLCHQQPVPVLGSHPHTSSQRAGVGGSTVRSQCLPSLPSTSCFVLYPSPVKPNSLM